MQVEIYCRFWTTSGFSPQRGVPEVEMVQNRQSIHITACTRATDKNAKDVAHSILACLQKHRINGENVAS